MHTSKVLKKYLVRHDLSPKNSFYYGGAIDTLWEKKFISRLQYGAFDRYRYLKHQNLHDLGVKIGLSAQKIKEKKNSRHICEETITLWKALSRELQKEDLTRSVNALYSLRLYEILKRYTYDEIKYYLDTLAYKLKVINDPCF